MTMNIDYIKKIFNTEFGSITEKFIIYELQVTEASKASEQFVANPGVYIWWHPNENVIKVGRHLTNSRKRALEHITANTGEKMQELSKDPLTKIFLFNVYSPSNIHWVAALEIYFEQNLSPIIKSARLG